MPPAQIDLPAQPISRLQLKIGRGFLPLWHNTDPFVLVESPRGCLKTCTILNLLMSRAFRWPGKRWYLWRSARTLLSTTVLKSFEDYVIPVWSSVKGMRLLNPGASTEGRKAYLFENGSEFIPVGLDDLLRGTSAEGAGGYLAEAIELDDRDRATALAGMMRQPGVPFHQIVVDVNPGAPGHWVNKAAEPVDARLRHVETLADYERLQGHNAAPAKDPLRFWKRLIVRIQDNPFYFDVEKWELTSAGKEYMKSLGILSGHLHKRWVGGHWTSAEGGVYPEFSEFVHCKPRFPIPSDWPIITGVDPGYDHPCAWLWFAVGYNNNLYIIDAIVGTGISLPELAKRVHEREKERGWTRQIRKRLGDPQYINAKRQESKPFKTQMRELEQYPLEIHDWPRTGGGMDAMVTAVRNRWLDKTLYVFSDVISVVEAIPGWQYARTAGGDIPAGDKDKYGSEYKDVNDVIRGVVASNPTFEHRASEVHDR